MFRRPGAVVFLFLLSVAGTASAQSLTGTWQVGKLEFAKCRFASDEGTNSNSSARLGPLAITQSGENIYVESASRSLRYQGVAYPGAAQATSCTAGTATDAPGVFHFSKVNLAKGSLQGVFVGRLPDFDLLISCKLKATRVSTTNPNIAACP